jgi:hypothetical protein
LKGAGDLNSYKKKYDTSGLKTGFERPQWHLQNHAGALRKNNDSSRFKNGLPGFVKGTIYPQNGTSKK